MARKLKLEEADSLAVLVGHSAFPLLMRELEDIVTEFQTRLLKTDAETVDASALFRAKCRVEGAERMLGALKTRLESIKKHSE